MIASVRARVGVIPCNPHDNPKGNTMLEAIVIAFMTTVTISAGATAIGPHQDAATCESVAVVSDRTGDVLYYNCK